MNASWRAKDGSKDSPFSTIHRLPLSQSDSDPLTELCQRLEEKKNRSSVISNSSTAVPTDPLNLFAQNAEEWCKADDASIFKAEPPSGNETADLWTHWMKPSENVSTSDVLLPPSSFAYIVEELVEKEVLLKENSLNRTQWLESLRHRPKDPLKKKEADVQAYLEFGIPGNCLLPFSNVLQTSLDKYRQEDQNVSSVKLVIQVALMLHDYDDPIFYHHKFYHLSELIYQFGRATYSRLVAKSPGIKINFSYKDVCKNVQELTRNWFAKVNVTRELLPRLYLEASLLKCYRLIEEGDYEDILERLSLCIRGVSDPLVNLYTRCFLLRVVQNLGLPQELLSRIGQLNYEEMIYLINNTPVSINVTVSEKPIKWILEGTVSGLISDFDKDQVMLNHFKGLDMELKHSGLLLNCLIQSSSPSLISEILLETLIPTIMESSKDDLFPQGNLILSLGKTLINSPDLTFHSRRRLQILKSVWNIASSISDIHLYLHVSLVWVEFLCINFKGSTKELNILFGDIISHVKESGEEALPLKNLFKKVIKYDSFVYSFLCMPNFLPLFHFLEGDSKYEVTKSILERLFGESLSKEVQHTDPLGNNMIVHLCQVLADFISPFTADDEIRQISSLICSVIRFIDSSHKSVEKRLNFYTDIRHKFSFLDRVQYELINSVNGLAVFVYQKVDGAHSGKTKGFVQACLAFSFITIPTLRDQITQIYALTHTAQVGLMNHCYGQAESCFKAALRLLPMISKGAHEPRLADAFNNVLSTLLLLPDDPPLGVFKFALSQCGACSLWSPKRYSTLLLNFLRILSVMGAWSKYPYSITGLDSNTILYYGKEAIIQNACNEITANVLEQILNLASDESIRCELLFELFQLVLSHADMECSSMASLSFKLWKATAKAKEPWIIKARRLILCDESLTRKGENLRILYESIVKYENKTSVLT